MPKPLNLLCLNSSKDLDATINIKDNNTFPKTCLDSNSIPSGRECLLFLNLTSMMMNNLNTDIQKDSTLKVPLKKLLRFAPIISMQLVKKLNLMIKLDQVLMIPSKPMLKMPSDALPSHILTLKKVKVDIPTKISQRLRKT